MEFAQADALPDGPEKVAALAALPDFPPSERAGDALKEVRGAHDGRLGVILSLSYHDLHQL